MARATTCPHCDKPTVEIAMRDADLTMTMTSCSACARTAWSIDGRVVTIGDVVEQVRNRRLAPVPAA